MKNYGLALLFFIGLAIGVAGTIYVPGFVNPYMPKSMKPAQGGVDGEVVSKLTEKNSLLVTVKTSDGSILVTFTKKVPEINLLVQEGDIVTLDIKDYLPFMNDPRINKVRKPDQVPAMKPAPAPEPETMQKEDQPAQAEPKAAEPVKPKAEQKQEKEKPAPEKVAPVTNSTM